MKRPSFQFYPGDWLNDAALRTCSIGARGLWIEMLCLMHQGSDYGYLKVNHTPILPVNLARISGATFQEVEGYLSELQLAGVYSVDGDGCIYSRRMIRDEVVREKRASGGILGGNPALKKEAPKVGLKVADKVNLKPNLKPTPSSSSSSSKKIQETEVFVLPDWINPEHWKIWDACQKRKNTSVPQKQLAVKKLEAWKAQGLDFAGALENAALGGNQGLFLPSTTYKNGNTQELKNLWAGAI